MRPVTASESSFVADAQNPAAATTDPFVWWSATSAKTTGAVPGTFARSATKRPSGFNGNTRRKTSIKGRRQVVVGLLAGTGVVGILGIGGISFAKFIESMNPFLLIRSADDGEDPRRTDLVTQEYMSARFGLPRPGTR